MLQANALVTDVEQCPPFVRVVFSAPVIADGLSPGRFVLADLGSYLRTPLFPACLDGETFWALILPDHPAAALQSETSVDLVGPLGRGFEVDVAARHLLLVADAVHLPALLPLVSQNPGFSAALLLSAPTAAQLYPVHLLPASLEVHIVTTDGSAGHEGSALDLFPDLVCWADCVCMACEPATYPALAEVVREVRIRSVKRFAQALIVPPIVCGVGACQGCAVTVVGGFKLACTDGPVFDLLELR
jgi:NAD(P)H-flavin reductase